MELVSSYNIGKSKILSTDVEAYVKEAKEIFKPSDADDNTVKIILNSNIKTKDMIGSPVKKAEANSIVKNIKRHCS